MAFTLFSNEKTDFFFHGKAPAVVVEQIDQGNDGRVFFDGSYWPARFFKLDSNLFALPGIKVNVVGRQGINLLVEPLEQ